MSPLSIIWHSIQHRLFPWLEEELDPLTEKQQELVRVIELAEMQNIWPHIVGKGSGVSGMIGWRT